ncbi:MAG: radical SAM protein [Roseburia sp.]|nr:radical SAM protein [Roseburia sp.]
MSKICTLCPRNCAVDRKIGEKGICGQSNELKVARAALHFWEEPCISGTTGSGTVFFSGCSLHCVFCQNEQIANGSVGKTISIERLVEIFFELEKQGANNINLVTPGHFIPQIREALLRAKQQGLSLPIVYNTSSYESLEALQSLEGLVDIYLPDFKYMSSDLSKKYSHAADYAEVAKVAIAEMVRQTGAPVFDEDGEDGLIKRGTIVRHLTLPGCMEDSKEILTYLHETYGEQIYISIMNQFTPLENVAGYPELNRKITEEEYDELIDFAIDLGIEQGFIQEGETAEESFIPDFDCFGV